MKDRFSDISGRYAQYRPHYPEALITLLLGHVPSTGTAWDCGTGNGQLAAMLAKHFEQIHATDISSSQLALAPVHPKISYAVQSAEATLFADQYFDLITVAQAIHWFDFDRFYEEVRRTLKPDGLLAVIGYGLLQCSPLIDPVIQKFYRETVGSYWDPERRYLDENYQTIPFPFHEIETPELHMTYSWSLSQLMGYLGTWSAVRRYQEDLHQDPLPSLQSQLNTLRINEITVRFPILLRLGKMN